MQSTDLTASTNSNLNSTKKHFKCIAVLSRKGGSGKTTVASLLAHGASTCIRNAYGLDIKTTVLRTDPRYHKPKNQPVVRGYQFASVEGRSVAEDNEFIRETVNRVNQPGNLLIYDGGANRYHYDVVGLELADYVLIPCAYSDDDLASATADWQNFTRYYAKKYEGRTDRKPPVVKIILNRWPGEEKRNLKLCSLKRISKFLDVWEHYDMLAPAYIQHLPSIVELTNLEDPTSTRLLDEMAGECMGTLLNDVNFPYLDYAEHVWQKKHANSPPKTKFHKTYNQKPTVIVDYKSLLESEMMDEQTKSIDALETPTLDAPLADKVYNKLEAQRLEALEKWEQQAQDDEEFEKMEQRMMREKELGITRNSNPSAFAA